VIRTTHGDTDSPSDHNDRRNLAGKELLVASLPPVLRKRDKNGSQKSKQKKPATFDTTDCCEKTADCAIKNRTKLMMLKSSTRAVLWSFHLWKNRMFNVLLWDAPGYFCSSRRQNQQGYGQ
jgi:hypothetical protein